MKRPHLTSALTAATLLLAPAASAQTQTPTPPLAPRDVPAKSIPVPTTVSPQLQAVIAQPLSSGWNTPPTTPDDWAQLVKKREVASAANVQPMADRLHVAIEPSTIDGVKVYILTPADIPPQNRNRLLVHVHGGCYVLGPHLAAVPEALQVAGISHIKTISVDYRMPPEAYFPAALDDAMTVYKAATTMVPPQNLGVFGSSAGGALTLEMMLRAKAAGLPMPGAIAPGTPMADATNAGDTFQTNALVDNVLVSPNGFCNAATKFYAHGHDLADPMLSPIYGDMHGFPPTILTSGTRDLLLSNTVRTNQKLREAGVETRLQVFEGQAHAQFYRDDRIPEDHFAITEIAAWFDKYPGQVMPGSFSDHAANERTFLAWIRTAIAVMAFGFLVAKFDLFLQIAARSLSAGRPTQRIPGAGFGGAAGAALIIAGTVMVVLAAVRFIHTRRALDSANPRTGRVGADLALAAIMAVLGLALVIYLGHTLLTGL